MRVETHSVDETLALGRHIGRLAAAAPAVTCIGLDGPLGAGKTQLTRGIAQGAEVYDDSLVSSPTFVLMNIYDGPKPVRHLDAYRLHSPHEFSEMGFEDLTAGAEGGGIIVVEWARRLAELMPADTLWIDIAHEGDALDECRVFEFTAHGGAAARLLERLESAIAAEGGAGRITLPADMPQSAPPPS
jgi:tRNA threonylcarbamoyladenosine biosynthesis protein TsaE